MVLLLKITINDKNCARHHVGITTSSYLEMDLTEMIKYKVARLASRIPSLDIRRRKKCAREIIKTINLHRSVGWYKSCELCRVIYYHMFSDAMLVAENDDSDPEREENAAPENFCHHMRFNLNFSNYQEISLEKFNKYYNDASLVFVHQDDETDTDDDISYDEMETDDEIEDDSGDELERARNGH